MVSFENFKKLEIRIGKVISAEKMKDSDKLVKLVFNIGNQERQIIAGIAEYFPDASVLIGKEMPLIINLEPKKLRGYLSEGMILAVDVGGKPVLLRPEEEVPPGSLVR